MPFIVRDAQGQIAALLREDDGRSLPELPANHPEVLAFLGEDDAAQQLRELDIELVRVLEDLIDVMIQKNLLLLTDLPDAAQRKLLSRKRLRSSVSNKLNLGLLSDNDVI